MKLTHIKAAAKIPSSEIESFGAVKEPVGTPVASVRATSFQEQPDTGVWECTVGKWRRQVKNAEFCHFVAGHCRFHADSGEVLEIRAGDSVFFPPNTTGTWEIIETARKTYVLLP